MAKINANLVKDLRDKTGSGIMGCKIVLVEVEGNFEKAVEILRKKGQATAAKKAGRATHE